MVIKYENLKYEDNPQFGFEKAKFVSKETKSLNNLSYKLEAIYNDLQKKSSGSKTKKEQQELDTLLKSIDYNNKAILKTIKSPTTGDSLDVGEINDLISLLVANQSTANISSKLLSGANKELATFSDQVVKRNNRVGLSDRVATAGSDISDFDSKVTKGLGSGILSDLGLGDIVSGITSGVGMIKGKISGVGGKKTISKPSLLSKSMMLMSGNISKSLAREKKKEKLDLEDKELLEETTQLQHDEIVDGLEDNKENRSKTSLLFLGGIGRLFKPLFVILKPLLAGILALSSISKLKSFFSGGSSKAKGIKAKGVKLLKASKLLGPGALLSVAGMGVDSYGSTGLEKMGVNKSTSSRVSGTAGGVLSGAGMGATIGVLGGPVGVAVGSGIGALIGGINGFLKSKKGTQAIAENIDTNEALTKLNKEDVNSLYKATSTSKANRLTMEGLKADKKKENSSAMSLNSQLINGDPHSMPTFTQDVVLQDLLLKGK